MPVQLPPKWAFITEKMKTGMSLYDAKMSYESLKTNGTTVAGTPTAASIREKMLNINDNSLNQLRSMITNIQTNIQNKDYQSYRYMTDLASKAMSGVSDDTTPSLGGDLDLAGHNIIDSTGSVTINDDLVCTTEKTDYQVFSGISDIVTTVNGAWTTTRSAIAVYYYEKAAAAETIIIAVDVTPHIRTASSKGYKLTSINPVYQITTQAMVGTTIRLYQVSLVNNTAVTPSEITLASGGALNTAIQANPYVTAVAVSTPAYLNTTHSHYCAELAVQSGATGIFRYYGLQLIFSRNDL